jgi:hypothetical protein
MPGADIFVTLVIEIFTTEGSTRSVMSAIDSAPTRVKAGFGTTVTGAGAPPLSAAISGWICELPDLVQPLDAAATIPTKTKGLVNRRLIIAEFPRIYAGSRRFSAYNPRLAQFIPEPRGGGSSFWKRAARRARST